MQAVLFADRHGAELAPLCDSQCPALLSVANRPLIELAIEDLVTAGATEILVVVSDDAAELINLEVAAAGVFAAVYFGACSADIDRAAGNRSPSCTPGHPSPLTDQRPDRGAGC